MIAHEGQVGISGVGFDIACGNLALRLGMPAAEPKPDAQENLAAMELAGRYARADRQRVAERGRSIAGGAMGDDAVILEGADGAASRAALQSAIHGAGRVFGRREACRRATRAARRAPLRDRGVAPSGGDLDESPMAHRRLPGVLAQHAGTVRVPHRLRPFALAMAGPGAFDPFRD